MVVASYFQKKKMSSPAPNRSRRQFNRPRKPDSSHNKNQAGSWKRTFARDGTKNADEEDLDESEQCVICADKIEIAAKSGCNHTTCHVCTFRQRALYDKKACLVCRTENEKLIFTQDTEKQYGDFGNGDFVKYDERYGIEFTSHNAHDITLELLNHRCLLCQEVFENFNKLSEHVENDHDRLFCTICYSNKKAFPQELKLYTVKQLQNHQIRGDEKGFDGHPLCRFCKGQRFYSEDELLIHMRERHEKCHVCDQIDPSNPQYFKNYPALEGHFRSDHYICNVQSCLDKKFVVFADELDLQAHMIGEHGGAFGTNFVVGANYSNNNTNRFHSQLSTFRPINNNNNNHSNDRNNNRANDSQNQNDSIATKRMRLEERARHYLNYSTTAFKEFQDLQRFYKDSELTAQQLFSSFKALFKENSEDDVYLLLFELSELFPSKSPQREDLSVMVKKHEESSKEENDFPALPGSTSTNIFGASWGNPNGSSSSKRKTKSKKAALEEQFPALPSAHSSQGYTAVKTNIRYRTIAQPKPKQQVVINQTPSNYVPNYLDAKPKTSSNRSSHKSKINDDLFPALPTAPAKKVIPRVNPVPKGNGAWDSSSASASSSAANSSLNLRELNDSLSDATGTSSSNNGAGKKNKKKKQILFQMGGH